MTIFFIKAGKRLSNSFISSIPWYSGGGAGTDTNAFEVSISTTDRCASVLLRQTRTTQSFIANSSFCGICSTACLTLHGSRQIMRSAGYVRRPLKHNARCGIRAIALQVSNSCILNYVVSILEPCGSQLTDGCRNALHNPLNSPAGYCNHFQGSSDRLNLAGCDIRCILNTLIASSCGSVLDILPEQLCAECWILHTSHVHRRHQSCGICRAQGVSFHISKGIDTSA